MIRRQLRSTAIMRMLRNGNKSKVQTPAITWGHNKDHRPDLKQLLYILTVADDGGVPIYFQTESGNVTDDSTHQRTWKLLNEVVKRPDFVYVADCKLATTSNMLGSLDVEDSLSRSLPNCQRGRGC
ncbi:MAG: hypothetical protein R3C05_06640 [Pirellulaceae bacterium]